MKHDKKHIQKDISSFNSDLKSVLSEEEEGHYLFIIADKKKADLFLFDKGEVVTSRGIMDPGVKKKTKINSGELYGRNTKLMHHIENQLQNHLQYVMKETADLINGKHINGVFIGGHQLLFHLIEKELPADLQKKLRGNFITELNISETELIKHCKKALGEYLK